jgi:A118 family predicted phage portal protein
MPLPTGGGAWPPPALADLLPTLEQWSAWYAGGADALSKAYGSARQAQPVDRVAQYRGGVVGAAARFFWGRPNGDLTKPQTRLHVPIAADLCQTSADLLFAEPPSITVNDTATQDRLAVLVDQGLHSAFAEGAEVGAALGGVYLRVTWDRDVAPAPFLTTVHADAALPEFRHGRLVAVTFWHVVRVDGQQVWRHLERHELDSQGIGVILHGLYQGSPNTLGRPVPLTEHSATENLARLVDADSSITTGTPGLDVEYIPNQRPQRTWRTHQLGRNFGRSDLDGIEPLMDALDETYSSWMRDLRLGKARILASESVLENLGPGRGAAFDTDQEVFSPLRVLTSREGSGLPIEKVQFEIRFEEHRATAQQLTEDILRSAGYSTQTFGESHDGQSATATEVHSRERRSYNTRDRKLRHWGPGAHRITTKLLLVDQFVFGSQLNTEGLSVDFAEGVQDSPEALARTVDMLRRAEAASTRTLVRMTHPDWEDEQITDEVAAILAESGRAVPDVVEGPLPGEQA